MAPPLAAVAKSEAVLPAMRWKYLIVEELYS
jgi:hypothetical protein